MQLRDRRWCFVSYTLQITGDVYWTIVVAASMRSLWWYALGDDDRARFTHQLSREALDEELVQIDELLESHDPADRARGEVRIQQRWRQGV